MKSLRWIQHDNRHIPTPDKTHFYLAEYGDAETACAAAEGCLRGFLGRTEGARPSDYRIQSMDCGRDGGHAYVIRVVR